MFLFALIESHIARNEEDLRLLGRIVTRDQAALAALYDRYSPLVYSLVLRIVRKTDEAEDLLQEIFMQVWNKAESFSQSKGSAYTWIVTIARRKAIDRLRSKEMQSRSTSIDDDPVLNLPDAAYASNPLHAAMTVEYEALMKSALLTLVPEQRVIIELSFFEGYTQSQIAERLELPLGTVKTRMRQGMIRLRDFLKERMDAGG